MSRTFCLVAVVLCANSLATGEDRSPGLVFVPNDKGEFTFDTGILRGTLRQGGKSQGLSSIVHIPTGVRLDRSLGIVSHYRVFTTGKRYGTAAWDWPGAAKLLPDGAVQTLWPATPDRPFEMTATYRWKDPQTLDVETTVTARADLSGFESFLASYFTEAFPSPYVWTGSQSGEAEGTFLLGEKRYGDWLMFISPGAGHVQIIRDGRWKLEPHPVDWTILPRLHAPLCFRRGQANGLKVIIMAPPEDCFAVATPYAGESHYSIYLSLFGQDLKAGQTAKARTRFLVADETSNEQLLALYRQYISDLNPPDAGPQ